MKILETQSAALSNHEVLAHLQSKRATPNASPSKIPNLATVVKELTEYLSPPPNPHPHPHPTTPSAPASASNPAASIRALLAALEPYALTKAELLMMVNLRPEELGLLDCVVEECDERFSEAEQGRILRLVARGGGGG